MVSKKILWVEDDEDIVKAYRPIFVSRGWEIISAPSAEKGKTMAKLLKPDLIIMDIIMAGEHGYAAIEDIKEEPNLKEVPIIVYSGVMNKWNQTTATREDAILSEACEFVDKSEKPEVLLKTIDKYLGEEVK